MTHDGDAYENLEFLPVASRSLTINFQKQLVYWDNMGDMEKKR